MSGVWLQHMAGLRVEEDRLADIPHPRTELTLHILGKCVQTGSLLGAVVVGPVSAFRSGQTDRDSVLQSSISCARRGALYGAAVGPLLAAAVLLIKDRTQAYDFCYRIRFNPRAMRIDRFGLLLAGGGAGAAAVLGRDAVTGAVMGLTGGVLLAVVSNAIFR